MLLFVRFPWNTIVRKNRDFEALVSDTWILTILALLLAFVIAFALAQLVPNKANQSDFKQRRLYFWAIGIVFTLSHFLYNFFHVSSFLNKKVYVVKFTAIQNFGVIWQTTATLIIGYVLLSYIVGKFLMKNNKFGTIFS